METDAPPPADFVCTDAPPPCDDPNGTPAWQQALELGAKVNLPRRRERARIAAANRDEAIRRGDRDAAVIAGHQAHEANQSARRDQKLLYRHAVREHHRAPKVAPVLSCVRTARPRGAGRPRARRTTSSRAGPSDDPGEPEPGPRSGQPLLFIVHERYGKVSRALARHLRELGL